MAAPPAFCLLGCSLVVCADQAGPFPTFGEMDPGPETEGLATHSPRGMHARSFLTPCVKEPLGHTCTSPSAPKPANPFFYYQTLSSQRKQNSWHWQSCTACLSNLQFDDTSVHACSTCGSCLKILHSSRSCRPYCRVAVANGSATYTTVGSTDYTTNTVNARQQAMA